jgi:DNA (cytosine-5)-methyltransferase 1
VTAYYNEIDPYAAQWLRNLIKEGLIADGEVDTRSIVDVRPSDLVGFTQCHFFAGLGGWGGALRLAGFPDGRPVWTGSCPCQPFSLAGAQKGFSDERHLWPVFRDLIRLGRPATVFGEQVASATEWLGLVRGDLEAMGYAVGAIPCEAASAGADHLRDRYWFVGNAIGEGQLQQAGPERAERGRAGDASSSLMADADDAGSQGRQLLPERADQRPAGSDGVANADSAAIRVEPGRSSGPDGASAREHSDDSEVDLADANEFGEGEGRQQRGRQQRGLGGDQEALDWVVGADGKARRVKPGIRLLAHGIPARVAKLRALGNAIDLRPAAAFIRASM